MQGRERADQVFQPRAGAAQDHRQVGRRPARELQGDAGVLQACGEACRADAFEQVHRGHVERQPQRGRGADRTVERGIEVGGTIATERLRRIHQQALRVDHPGIQRHPVQERLQRRSRRAPGLDHVDVAQPRLVAERHRADVRTRLQAGVVDHQQRRRRARRQVGEIRRHALLQRALQRCIQRRGDPPRARIGGAQPLRQQRSAHRRTQPARHHLFDPRIVDLRLRPRAAARHACQQLVASLARGLRRAVRAQPTGRLRQHREQGGFRMRQPRGWLAEIGPTRRFNTFDGAAERRAFQVQRQDLALAQVRFQLQCSQHLPQLAQWRARARTPQAWVEDARHLHGQRGTAGHDPSVAQHLPTRTQQRHRIHPGVLPEPAVLVRDQGLHIQRRHLLRRGRIAPDALRIGERTQRAAVARGDHHAGVAPARQRNGKQQVEQQHAGKHGDAAPAQPGQQASPADPATGRHACTARHRRAKAGATAAPP